VGVVYSWHGKKSRFSTNMSLYLRNDTRYGHSYNGLGLIKELTLPTQRYEFE